MCSYTALPAFLYRRKSHKHTLIFRLNAGLPSVYWIWAMKHISFFSLLPLSDVERCIFLCLANIPTVVCLAWIIDRRHEPPAACLFVQDSRVHRGGSGTHKERKGGTVRGRMKQMGKREKAGKWWWKRAEYQKFRDIAKARRMDRTKWKTRKFWCRHDVALKTNLSLPSDKKKRGALMRQPYVCQYLQTALSQLAKKISLLTATCVVQTCAKQLESWKYLMDMVVVFKAKGATESVFLFPEMSFSFETRFH